MKTQGWSKYRDLYQYGQTDISEGWETEQNLIILPLRRGNLSFRRFFRVTNFLIAIERPYIQSLQGAFLYFIWMERTSPPVLAMGMLVVLCGSVMRVWWDVLCTVWCLKPRWQIHTSMFPNKEVKERIDRRESRRRDISGLWMWSDCE